MRNDEVKSKRIPNLVATLPSFSGADLAPIGDERAYLNIILFRQVKQGTMVRFRQNLCVAKSYLDTAERKGFFSDCVEFTANKWEKTDKQGETMVKVKGRDYYDLIWCLQKGIQPNLFCIEGFETMKDLKEKLLAMIASIDSRSNQLDLDALIENPKFVDNISRNMKTILEREISEKL